MTMMDTACESSSPGVAGAAGEGAEVLVPPGADTDPRPGAPNIE